MNEKGPRRRILPSPMMLALAIATGIVCGMAAILLVEGLNLPI